MVPETATQFSGEMLIHRADEGSEWRPNAKVAFTDSDADPGACHCNGIVATWYPQDPKVVYVYLSVEGVNIELGRVLYGKPIKFKFTATLDGNLKLEVEDQVKVFGAVTLKRNNLHLSCSTADVEFTSIDVQ